MKKENLTYLLKKPSAIDFDQTAALKEVLKEYPYFQAARAIRLKGLKNAKSLHYNEELKLTAAHTIDRSILFDFITSEEFLQNEIADQITKQELYQKNIAVFDVKEVREKDDNLSLDKALRMKVRESEQVFDPEIFRKKEAEQNTSEKEGEKDHLELGRPLSFNRSEIHSFSEWLKLAAATPVEREESAHPEEDEEKQRKFELINEFIAKSPRISPTKTGKKINLAEENMTAPEALMTETLARVYLEQKNYKKAIQAYKILILKNPEKSGFFADQIRAIEKLQENNS